MSSSRFFAPENCQQIPSGQEAALRAAEAGVTGGVWRAVVGMVMRGDFDLALADDQIREGQRSALAGCMIDQCVDAWKSGVAKHDPLASYRALKFTTIGHPDRETRYGAELPLETVVRQGRDGKPTVFGHAVASMVDWQAGQIVVVASQEVMPDSPEKWLVRRYDVMSGACADETVTDVERVGAEGTTLFTFADDRSPRQAYSQSPTCYVLVQTPDGRAKGVVVSNQYGGTPRRSIEAILTDDVGVLEYALGMELLRRGLPPRLLVDDVAPQALYMPAGHAPLAA